jgi:hypothetical protein
MTYSERLTVTGTGIIPPGPTNFDRRRPWRMTGKDCRVCKPDGELNQFQTAIGYWEDAAIDNQELPKVDDMLDYLTQVLGLEMCRKSVENAKAQALKNLRRPNQRLD